MDVGGLPQIAIIGAAAGDVDKCILAETLVKIYKNVITVAAAHNSMPSCSEKRLRHLLASLLRQVPLTLDLTNTYKLERAAYSLCGAPKDGWSIKSPYYTDTEKKEAVFGIYDGENDNRGRKISIW